MEITNPPAPRVPREPIREIDWLAIAPWLMLLRAPAATVGWPLVLGALGLLLLEPAWLRVMPEGGPYEMAYRGLICLPASLVEPYAFGDKPSGLWELISPVLRWIAWLFLGGMIAESVGRQLTGSPRVGVIALIKSEVGRLPSRLGALAMFGVAGALLAGALVLYGLALSSPMLAPVANPLWAVAALLGGLPLVIVIAVGYLGSPLLVAAQAIDRTDAFDSVSRVAAFCLQRLVRLVGYLLVAALVGLAVGTLLELAINGTFYAMNALVAQSDIQADSAMLNYSASVFAKAVRGFYPAYLFSAGTAIYLLLRRDIDGQPIDEMAGVSADQASSAA